jgi:ATP-dependent DNA helicase RecG
MLARSVDVVAPAMRWVESETLAFKSVWRDEYLKWIYGFANAKGGKLMVGVDDDGNIRGLEDARRLRLQEEIPNKVVSHLGIVVDVVLHQEQSLEWLEIRVSRSDFPISFHGVYHYRSGSTRQELKGTALHQFLLRKLGRTWDGLVPEGASLAAIDKNAVAHFVRLAKQANRTSPTAACRSTEGTEEGDEFKYASRQLLQGVCDRQER